MSATSTAYSWIRIETPENIEFTYELAGPGTRMAAYFIDFLLINVIYGVLSWIFYMVLLGIDFFDGPSWREDLILGLVIAIWSILFPLGGYFTFFETILHGQTPGKRWLGIRVIQTTGAPADFIQILIRNLFRLIDCFMPFQYAIGSFALIFSKKTQRLGDQVAGVIVVKERKQEKASPWQWKANAGRFVLHKADKVELTAEEFDLLMEYIRVHQTMDKDDRNRISQRLAKAILDRAQLWRHPDFSSMVEQVKAAHPAQRYVPSELILRSFLDLYLQRDK